MAIEEPELAKELRTGEVLQMRPAEAMHPAGASPMEAVAGVPGPGVLRYQQATVVEHRGLLWLVGIVAASQMVRISVLVTEWWWQMTSPAWWFAPVNELEMLDRGFRVFVTALVLVGAMVVVAQSIGVLVGRRRSKIKLAWMCWGLTVCLWALALESLTLWLTADWAWLWRWRVGVWLGLGGGIVLRLAEVARLTFPLVALALLLNGNWMHGARVPRTLWRVTAAGCLLVGLYPVMVWVLQFQAQWMVTSQNLLDFWDAPGREFRRLLSAIGRLSTMAGSVGLMGATVWALLGHGAAIRAMKLCALLLVVGAMASMGNEAAGRAMELSDAMVQSAMGGMSGGRLLLRVSKVVSQIGWLTLAVSFPLAVRMVLELPEVKEWVGLNRTKG